MRTLKLLALIYPIMLTSFLSLKNKDEISINVTNKQVLPDVNERYELEINFFNKGSDTVYLFNAKRYDISMFDENDLRQHRIFPGFELLLYREDGNLIIPKYRIPYDTWNFDSKCNDDGSEYLEEFIKLPPKQNINYSIVLDTNLVDIPQKGKYYGYLMFIQKKGFVIEELEYRKKKLLNKIISCDGKIFDGYLKSNRFALLIE